MAGTSLPPVPPPPIPASEGLSPGVSRSLEHPPVGTSSAAATLCLPLALPGVLSAHLPRYRLALTCLSGHQPLRYLLFLPFWPFSLPCFLIFFPIVLSLTGFFPPLLYRFPYSSSPSLFSSFSLSPVYFLSPLPSQEESAGPRQWGQAPWGWCPHEAGSLGCQHRRVLWSYFRLSCKIWPRRYHRHHLHLGREPEHGPG